MGDNEPKGRFPWAPACALLFGAVGVLVLGGLWHSQSELRCRAEWLQEELDAARAELTAHHVKMPAWDVQWEAKVVKCVVVDEKREDRRLRVVREGGGEVYVHRLYSEPGDVDENDRYAFFDNETAACEYALSVLMRSLEKHRARGEELEAKRKELEQRLAVVRQQSKTDG